MQFYLQQILGDCQLRFKLGKRELLLITDLLSGCRPSQAMNSPSIAVWSFLMLATDPQPNSIARLTDDANLSKLRTEVARQFRAQFRSDFSILDCSLDLELSDDLKLVGSAFCELAIGQDTNAARNSVPPNEQFEQVILVHTSLRVIAETIEKAGNPAFSECGRLLNQHMQSLEQQCADDINWQMVDDARHLISCYLQRPDELTEQQRQICETVAGRNQQVNQHIVFEPDQLENILQSLARLEQLESEFSAALQQEKIASLKELAYGASHEINNPLGNIATRSQTLMRGEQDPERRKQLAMIVSQAFRAHDMISDMMLFAHPPTPIFKVISLEDVVIAAIEKVSLDAEQQQTTIDFSCDVDSTELSADRDHIEMQVKAILQNALDAIGQGGKVCVGIKKIVSLGQSFFCVHIADDGPGLNEKARRHLFDPFFSGREAGRGLGFGLSMAWTVAQIHGGTIEVADSNDGGAVFSILLPATRINAESFPVSGTNIGQLRAMG